MNVFKPAPIAMIVYNRPELTRIMVESIKKNRLAAESDLFIFSDGPKDALQEDAVREVREYLHSVDGFHTVSITERKEHFGLANSVISAVNKVIALTGRIIVIEDDLDCAPFLLDYLNEALERYEQEKKVYTITGFIFPTISKDLTMDNTFFMKLFNPWTWATWADRWSQFDQSAAGWEILSKDKAIRDDFDFDNSYKYSKALETQMSVGIDSWAIRWYWSIFKNDGLNLFPYKTLARNLGFNGSGTHSVFVTDCLDVLAEEKFDFNFPSDIEESKAMRKIVVAERKKRNIISLKDAKQRAFDSISQDFVASCL
jgi:hypothetical protein